MASRSSLSVSQMTILLLLLLSSVSAQKVINLSGSDWTLQSLPLNISVPGSVPSQAHLDLYAAKVIEDPYFGLNDFSLRWVADTNWTYISAPISQLSQTSKAQTWLLFNGLDTFTSIEFCGEHVAATNNQFRQYYFDISDLVRDCCIEEQVLSINFGSAPRIADGIAQEPGQETWPFGVEMSYEYLNRQFIRKEGSDFGWDWGPAFAPAGIWQPAYVIQLFSSADASSDVYIRNSDIDISRLGQLNNLPPDQGAPWLLNASLDLLGVIPLGASLRYEISESASNQTVSTGLLTNITTTSESITGTAILDPSAYELWWPRGLGPQNLYNITISIFDSGDTLLASVNKRIGFRTIVLNLGIITDEQIAQGIAPGNNWHFEINGHEFYAKGSNFIPPDAFWPRVTEKKMRQLFDSVTAGNQNMLRIWASGAYTPDFIYDIADEEGVLLWSEFEFGDSLYPVNPEFLGNVREEAIYNVRRVNHHPSLALWAGGNELESLELLIVNQTAPDQYERYKAEYEQLFLNTLLPVVYSNSKSISYIPSSTTNGYIELNFSLPIPMIQRYNNKEAGSVYGDTDFYNYDSSLAFNFSAYPVGRFANEFGYHSMPSLQTWQQAVPPSELYFNSSTIQLRNHHYPPGGLNISNFENTTKGMGEMTIAAQRWYPVPNKTDPLANFSAWCHTTQIFQADFYKSEIQFYRRGSGFPNRQLGSLYWQLEDIWQAPTWAGIEYDGRWKVLHYTTLSIYKPIIISPFFSSDINLLEIYITSDLWSPASGTAFFTWYTWSGDPIPTNITPTPASADFVVGGLNTTRVLSLDLSSTSSTSSSSSFGGVGTGGDGSGWDPKNAILSLSLIARGSLPNSSPANNANETTTTIFKHDNFFHPVPLSEAKLVDPGLVVSFSSSSSSSSSSFFSSFLSSSSPSNENANQYNKFTVKATTGIAVWVWLDYPAGLLGRFDDNAFLLRKGEEKEIRFRLIDDDEEGGEVEGWWQKKVTVRSLWDNYLP